MVRTGAEGAHLVPLRLDVLLQRPQPRLLARGRRTFTQAVELEGELTNVFERLVDAILSVDAPLPRPVGERRSSADFGHLPVHLEITSLGPPGASSRSIVMSSILFARSR